MRRLVSEPVPASSCLPQNPIDGLREIVSNKVGLSRPLRRMPGEFAFPVAGSHKDPLRTRIASQLNVGATVSDHERTLQIDAVFARGAIKHARFGLAA
jgi:hypothetical protein